MTALVPERRVYFAAAYQRQREHRQLSLTGIDRDMVENLQNVPNCISPGKTHYRDIMQLLQS